MATVTTTVTPRLRMVRHSPVPYDRSAQTTTSTSEPGPSRIPDFSQLVNVDLRAMDLSDDNIYSSDEPRTPHVPTPPTATRSENPAAVLRALLSRLPARSSSPTPSRSSSRQNISERESDYDASETASATPSAAQSSLKDIFGRALQEPGDTPRKTQSTRQDMDPSGIHFTPMPEGSQVHLKGKGRSLSDDEAESTIAPPRTRFKASSQPITKDFLRERFSNFQEDSAAQPRTAPQDNSVRDSDSSQTTPPVATSTPLHSLRISVNSEFQSNLLDQDTEMQHAVLALDSDADDFTGRSVSPPPTLRRRTPASGARELAPIRSPDLTHDRDERRSIPRPSSRSSLSFGSGRNSQVDDRGDDGEQSMSLTTLEALRPPSRPVEDTSSRMQFSPSTPHDNLSLNIPSPPKEPWDSSRLNPLTTSKSPSPGSFTTAGPPSSPASPRGSIRTTRNSIRSMKSVRQNERNLDERSALSTAQLEPTVHRDNTTRSSSPLPREYASPAAPSLQAFENSDHHRSTSPQHVRSLSPLLSFTTKSGNTSLAQRWSKPFVTPNSNGDQVERPSTSSRLPPSEPQQPINSPSLRPSLQFDSSNEYSGSSRLYSQAPNWSNSSQSGCTRDPATDELRETDFSPQNGAVMLGTLDPPDDISEDELVLEQPQDSSRGPKMINSSPAETQAPVKPQTSFIDADALSTPPRPLRPKSPRVQFKIPSPPKGLPDLPTPSSSDESEGPSRRSRQTTLKTPAGSNISRGLPTPKPPGGWLSTPMPSHHQTTSSEADTSSWRREDRNMKTPKPPGSWLSTPGPVASSGSTDRISEEETPAERNGLLTPVPSLSKGSFFDPKTPGVPGAWMATPAARKNLQKVRFNAEASSKGNWGDGHTTASLVNLPDQSSHVDLSGTSTRSPRKTKGASIRVLDAFGREQDAVAPTPVDSVRNRSGLRILDAMGNELPEEARSVENEGEDDADTVSATRGELLSRIRQGLDDLLDDVDDLDQDEDLLSSDRARIEELNVVSMQARQARLGLYQRATNSRQELGLLSEQELSSHTISSTSKSDRRNYLIMAIVQIVLIVIMYRLCMNHARNYFMNSYYDPFNPELHLFLFKSDSSSLLEAFWPRILRRRGSSVWYDSLHSIGNLGSYLGRIWSDGVQQGNYWTPT